MIRICFVCLGNICRSPMAEFLMKKRVEELGLSSEFFIASRGTSYEEEGNDMYPPAKRMLEEKGIPFGKHQATRLEKDDYEKFDYFYCMEERNVSSAKRILGEDLENKIHTLLPYDIADPWYSEDFLSTYQDLEKGIDLILKSIQK